MKYNPREQNLKGQVFENVAYNTGAKLQRKENKL